MASASILKQTTTSTLGLCSNLISPLKIKFTLPKYFHCSTVTFSCTSLTNSTSPRKTLFVPNTLNISTLAQTWEESIQLQVPLFLRQLTFSTSLEDLKRWRKLAQDLANAVGSSYLESDGGPDSKDLLREIEWLLEDAVEGYSPNLAMLESPLTLATRASIEDLYSLWNERIKKRKPFQYIVGCAHWRDLVLSVQEGVLIPRPETEQLIDIAQNAILSDGSLAKGLWADLGTGSGALALGLGQLLGPEGRVVAVDLSHVAVSVARYNVQRYGLQSRVDVRQGSWFVPMQDVNGELAGLLSNPPYIPADQISGLQAEVGNHEPRLALDGGKEGIDDLLLLCKGAISALRPGGFVGFETNGGRQADFIAEFLCSMSDNNFRDVQVISDYANIPRFVTAFRC